MHRSPKLPTSSTHTYCSFEVIASHQCLVDASEMETENTTYSEVL